MCSANKNNYKVELFMDGYTLSINDTYFYGQYKFKYILLTKGGKNNIVSLYDTKFM